MVTPLACPISLPDHTLSHAPREKQRDRLNILNIRAPQSSGKGQMKGYVA
jgi:hypothetical protein